MATCTDAQRFFEHAGAPKLQPERLSTSPTYDVGWRSRVDLLSPSAIIQDVPLGLRVANMTSKIDRTAVKKVSIDSPSSDAAYWRTRPPGERIAQVEAIRREFHNWEATSDDADIQRLQRVYRVCKRS